jgi:NADPH:quinone reductase-like Zn-dependent oxidoreductase
LKAVYFKKHGDLDVLEYGDFPTPKVGPHDVLVKVKACGLNHLDIWTRQGMPGIQIPLPHILGCEITGTVAQVGSAVQSFKKGDRVMIAPGQGCGRCQFCFEGRDSSCENYQMMGFQLNGGYAEYAVAREEHLIAISDRWDFAEWASTPLVFLTSWHMLLGRAQMKPGETVLVQAGGSGIGIAAIQIAKLSGATVITTVGSEEKVKKAKKLGADFVINYRKKNFAQEVKKITNGRGVDIVFEHIGPETWTGSLSSLARGGRLVFCGATSGPEVTMDLRFVFVKQYSILGSYMGSRHELMTVIRLLEEKKLHPVVDSVFPLRQAKEAQKKMLSRNFFGKIVLEV